MNRPGLTLAGGRLEFEFNGYTRSRPLKDKDVSDFESWISAYRLAGTKGYETESLLAIGREIHGFLNGNGNWFGEMMVDLGRRPPDSPLVFEFGVSAGPGKDESAFLEVPWELAADKDGFLAGAAGGPGR